MKIALFDTNVFKFTSDMHDWWLDAGHEVRRRHVFTVDALWADVLWFDCVDRNLAVATTRRKDMIAGKRVVARCIDIDAWAGHFRGVDWSRVDHLVFIAKHIRDYVLSQVELPDNVDVHLIPCGVNLDRFTLRRDLGANREIAVVMKLWHGKGLDLLLQLIAIMPDYRFHVCGRWGLNGLEAKWHRKYVDQFLANFANWTHVEWTGDMNAWLEDKSTALVCSKKEAFSYAAAEAAAKGMHPVVHHFYGAEDIWPAHWLWRTVNEAACMIRDMPHEPESWRAHIQERYPLKRMMEAFDELLV